MTLNASGNLGIGTSSPANKLTVSGEQQNISVLNTDAGTFGSPSFSGVRFYGFSETQNGWVAGVEGGNSQSNGYNGTLRFLTRADTVNVDPAERMRIDGSGNVGIGTSSPGALLDVSASTGAAIRITSSATGNGAGVTLGDLQFYGNDSSVPGAGIKASISAVTNAALGDDADLIFRNSDGTTNNIERMRINYAGNVGIGTTTPGSKLAVSQTAAAQATQVSGNNNAQGFAQLNTIVRQYPVVSLGTKLIIPFISQTGLNSSTTCKVWGHGARYNNTAPLAFEITFAVGSLNSLFNLASWGGEGNYASIAINGMNIEITFTSAYTSATSDGIFACIQYMTNNSVLRSIDVANIAMN
jgi:hypothetical protein